MIDFCSQRQVNGSKLGFTHYTKLGFAACEQSLFPGGGASTPYSGLYGEAPPGRGAFLKLAVTTKR